MPPKKRKSYTVNFKLNVILKAQESNNHSQTAKEFGVHRKQVQMWLHQKEQLAGCVKREGQDLRRRRIKPTATAASSRNKARRPELEKSLREWILDQREKSRPVQLEEIRRKALELADDTNFTASKGWLYRFLKRNAFTCRRATHVGQSLPSSAGLMAKLFFDEVGQAVRAENVQKKQIINMDETPCYFDLPDARTVNQKGEKSVAIATSGYEKMRFTTVLAVNADGGKLTPMLIFKNLKNVPKLKKGEKWPENIYITVSHGGTMNEALLEEWTKSVYNKRPGSFFGQPNLLIMDCATSHKQDVVTSNAKRCKVVFVPKGCTSILQPLDVAINKPFKQYLAEQWKAWMFQPETERRYTPQGKRQRASYVQVAHWVATAWEKVTTESVINSFTCTGITGSVDMLHSKLRSIVETSTMDSLETDGFEVSDEEEELLMDEDAGLIETDGNPTVVIELAPKRKAPAAEVGRRKAPAAEVGRRKAPAAEVGRRKAPDAEDSETETDEDTDDVVESDEEEVISISDGEEDQEVITISDGDEDSTSAVKREPLD